MAQQKKWCEDVVQRPCQLSVVSKNRCSYLKRYKVLTFQVYICMRPGFIYIYKPCVCFNENNLLYKIESKEKLRIQLSSVKPMNIFVKILNSAILITNFCCLRRCGVFFLRSYVIYTSSNLSMGSKGYFAGPNSDA